MSQLLNLDFHRLLKSLLFRISVVLSAVYAVILNITRYLKLRAVPDISSAFLDNNNSSADSFTFSGAMILIFISAVIISSFIGSEYSEGTIRNSFIAGHSRKEVYLSNFIVCASASVMILLSYILASIISGAILLEGPQLEINRLIISILSQCLSMVTFSALLVFIAMLIHSRSAGTAALLLSTGIMLCFAMSSTTTLNEPQYYTDHSAVYTEEGSGEEKYGTFQQQNPRYISGFPRAALEQLNNAMPVNGLYRVYLNSSQSEPENFGLMALYSAFASVLFNCAGIALFRKKDIR